MMMAPYEYLDLFIPSKGNNQDEGSTEYPISSEKPTFSDDAPMSSGGMCIHIKFPDGIKIATLKVEANDTIATIKAIIQRTEGIPRREQRLSVRSGSYLDDNTTLERNGIQNEATIYLSLCLAGGAPPGKRPKPTILASELTAKNDDHDLVKACFAIASFRSRSWIDSLPYDKLKEYQSFLETERNYDRQCTGTVDFIQELGLLSSLAGVMPLKCTSTA